MAKRPSPNQQPKRPAPSQQPKHLQVDESPFELAITRPWNRQVGYLWLFFGAFFGLFVYFGVADSLVEPSVANVLITLLLFSLTGVMVYIALAQLFNQTTIRVSYDELSVRSGPLPWPGKVEIFRGDVKQFFVREHMYKDKNSRLTYTYSVSLVDAKQKHYKLVDGLPSSSEARFLEQKIEQYLRLKDEPIKGEYLG
jgi:hypothetical protein